MCIRDRVKTSLSPVTAPGKKPDRPAVKLRPKSVQVPSVSPSYNNTPLSPRIPGVTVSRVAVPATKKHWLSDNLFSKIY